MNDSQELLTPSLYEIGLFIQEQSAQGYKIDKNGLHQDGTQYRVTMNKAEAPRKNAKAA